MTTDARDSLADLDLIGRTLGYRPFEDSLRRTIAWALGCPTDTPGSFPI